GGVTAVQQVECALQSGEQLIDGQRLHVCRGELDREWDAVQTTTHFCDLLGVRFSKPEPWGDKPRALDKQPHRVTCLDVLESRLGVWDRQRRYAQIDFTLYAQRLAA